MKKKSETNNHGLVIIVLTIAFILIAIVIVLIFFSSLFSGIGNNINFDPPPLEGVRVRINVDYTEINNLNHSDIENELENIGYSVYTASPYNEYDTYLNFHSDNITGDIWGRTFENGTQRGELFIWYYPSQNQSYQNRSMALGYLMSESEEIASICNITLDWNQAAIVYDPEWYYGREVPNVP